MQYALKYPIWVFLSWKAQAGKGKGKNRAFSGKEGKGGGRLDGYGCICTLTVFGLGCRKGKGEGCCAGCKYRVTTGNISAMWHWRCRE